MLENDLIFVGVLFYDKINEKVMTTSNRGVANLSALILDIRLIPV